MPTMMVRTRVAMKMCMSIATTGSMVTSKIELDRCVVSLVSCLSQWRTVLNRL